MKLLSLISVHVVQTEGHACTHIYSCFLPSKVRMSYLIFNHENGMDIIKSSFCCYKFVGDL
jgi:hypothetical protein